MPENSTTLAKPSALERSLGKVPEEFRPVYEGSVAFGPSLTVERFRYKNGLTLLCCEDDAAPVLSFHTWFKVGSRHERPGKTGIAHLFEHLMFGETEHLGPGEYDHQLEEAGAETNASTWLDFTQYTVNAPAGALPLVVELEAERLRFLSLTEKQVSTEKDVVANERRYRVDDDIEGATSELLWSTAFREHAYHWPTIGWMPDILGFCPEDCTAFYKTYYAPNNATIVVVGDFKLTDLLTRIGTAYAPLTASELPVEDVHPEPPQIEERKLEIAKPTPTEKLVLGYRGPSLGDFDHVAISVLGEVLCGGRPSRLVKRLVHELEIASDVRMSVGPFRDPGLIEISVTARDETTAEALLAVVDEEFERVKQEPVTQDELERALARLELGMLASLETVDGKASTLGFYETVLGRPATAFERLDAMQKTTLSDLRRAARTFLRTSARTTLFVRCAPEAEDSEAEEPETEVSDAAPEAKGEVVQ
jgi:zinc protease